MKIAFDALNVRRGGGLTVLTRLARAFADAGHEAHVVTSALSVVQALSDMTGIEAHHVPGADSALTAQLFRHRRWDATMREIGAERVFGFNYWTPTTLPQVTYHINVIPLLSFTQRRQAIGLQKALIQARYSRLALRRSALNLFESEHILSLAKAAAGNGIVNPLVRYIGIDIPNTARSLAQPGRHIISVTSGARHKRNELLFALHRALNRNRPNGERIGLKIIGLNPKDMDAIAAEKSYAAGQPDVELLGYLDRESLYQELARATALVSFSELESFFMVPVEAMAVGTPAIVNDASSIRESVGEAALLIPPCDIDAAVRHVEHLLDPAVRAHWSSLSRSWAQRFDGCRCAATIVRDVDEMPV